MFAIYLSEDAAGFVTVSSDHYGPGLNSWQIGMEILHNLHALERSERDLLAVQNVTYSLDVH
jgi:hypothetical protein